MTGPEDSPAPSPAPSPAREYRTLDARSLRGLAHPLRMRLLSSLRQNGPATASQLGARLGESSGATSYHLRQLADHGFIEDAPEFGKGRERWWKAAVWGTTFDDRLYDDPDPAVRGAADLFIHEVATMHSQELSTWIGTSRDWGLDWIRSSDMSDFTLRLTPAQTHELIHRVHALIESYTEQDPGDDAGAAQVRMHLHAFPRTTD
ncbi:ArsR/SmtB family transcription factor [Streptomyces sp. NBC_00344]|uniref:ArsR/SmtB family transcription factor n=1 Tax=Streptomyces sp. NBC_00344 TaxID=2975720 RepID=UPI002E24C17A